MCPGRERENLNPCICGSPTVHEPPIFWLAVEACCSQYGGGGGVFWSGESVPVKLDMHPASGGKAAREACHECCRGIIEHELEAGRGSGQGGWDRFGEAREVCLEKQHFYKNQAWRKDCQVRADMHMEF